jgi:hypothetical protein
LSGLVGFAVRTLQLRQAAAAELDLGASPAIVYLFGTLFACLAAALATWRLMAPVQNTYRQGMFALVAVFATFVCSGSAVLADVAFGRVGLLGLVALAALICLWLGRRLTRAAR